MIDDVPEGSELEKKLTKYFKFDNEHRGSFLVSATQGESYLEDVIASHFESKNKEKRSLLISLVISQLSFNAKIRIVTHLIQTYYPKIQKEFPNLENQLESVRNFRNKMAHYSIDSRTERVMKYAGQKLSLVFHKNGKIHYQVIDKKSFEEKITLAQNVTADLAEIDEIIENKQKSKKVS